MALTKITGNGIGSVSGVNLSSGNVTVIDGQGFYFGDGSYRIEGKDDGANARIGFVTNSSEIARFTSDGLTFNGDTAAANALDDYEEGTWTPNIGGNATYTNQTAQYVKVGDLVHIQCNIEINAIGTGSANTLFGLPFTSFNNLHVQTVNVAYYASIATSMIWLSGYVENNAVSIKFSGNTTSNTTIQHNTQNVFQNNARIILTATYRTS